MKKEEIPEQIQATINNVRTRLDEGNDRFVKDKLDGKLQDSHRRKELTSGQAPYAIVLGCADSRVIPEFIYDAGIGELFVARVAGNVANTSSIASIEYAVAHLGTRVIVVLGHEGCGAVTEARKQEDNGYNLNHLLAHITPAVCACGSAASLETVVKKNAVLNANELINRSSIIGNAVKENRLIILPAYYELGTGNVQYLDLND